MLGEIPSCLAWVPLEFESHPGILAPVRQHGTTYQKEMAGNVQRLPNRPSHTSLRTIRPTSPARHTYLGRHWAGWTEAAAGGRSRKPH
jgi:hypothetical protein